MAERSPTRRGIVRLTGIAALTGLAGCSGTAFSDDGPSTDTPTDEPTPTATTTSEPTTTEPEELTPHGVDEGHRHGTMVVTVNDETYHLGDKPWNVEERTEVKYFHFHVDGERDIWHVHALDVTLAYAIRALPRMELDGDVFTFRDHTYDATEAGTEIAVTANGETIDDPGQYVLEEGDEIEIAVETDAETPTPGAETESTETETGAPMDGTETETETPGTGT